MDEANDIGNNEKSLVQSETDLLQEILDTEDSYVDCLRKIAEEYMPLFDTTDPEKTKIMKKFKSLIFGAIEDIYIYHTNVIYPDLIAINKKGDSPPLEKFAAVIAYRKDAFDPYAFYVQGRPASKMLLAYNLGQHKSLKLIDSALNSSNKTRDELEKILQEPINRIKLYAKLLTRMISKTPLDDPNIDILSDAFGAVDLEDEYDAAVTAWAAERIKECPIDLREQGDLYRHVTIHFSKNGGSITYACLFLFDDGLIITTPELYDLPPEQHSKELTFLHYIPLTGCEVITDSNSEDKFDVKIRSPDGGQEVFAFWAGNKNNRNKLLKILANSSRFGLIKFSPSSSEKTSAKPIETLQNSPQQKRLMNEQFNINAKAQFEAGSQSQDESVASFQSQIDVETQEVETRRAAEETEEVAESTSQEFQHADDDEEKTTEIEKPDKANLLAFWRTKEEEAKMKKKSQTSKTPLMFKYGKEVGEEERKARAFKLKESNRFKFWKLKEQEMKKAQKAQKQMKSKGRGKHQDTAVKSKASDKE